MTAMQLNKLQIKAELLTVLSKLQSNLDMASVDVMLETLLIQEDKKTILEVLIKDLNNANEQKSIFICFLLLKLCEKSMLESALWDALKSRSIADSTKSIILNVLKDMGNKIDYEKLSDYFKNPDEVIDSDTQRLLQNAIINPEAQIDFLDFLNSLSDKDSQVLIKSLGDDYSSDDLANILNPFVLYAPTSELGKISIEVLGSTKSQLALHALLEAQDFVDDEETLALIKKNISKLKISGIREDNAIEFYKNLLDSKPYCSYSSYPDGHGNQALIFSRERENESIQVVAIVINDICGIVDCFGFNEISKPEFERIVNKFYKDDEHIYINVSVVKSILLNAEKLTRETAGKISYEYICWKTLLSDIQPDPVPIELTLESQFKPEVLTENELEQVFMLDFLQRWFFDTEVNESFKSLVSFFNSEIKSGLSNLNLEEAIEENFDLIFTTQQKKLLDKRLLMSAYLKYLACERIDAQFLYSLYYDEDKKKKLAVNIIRKSIYEYYVALRFKCKEEHKMTNIFAMRNKANTVELSKNQIDSMILTIESLWVKNE